MTDMLVKLYDLPPLAPALARAAEAGVTIRRGLGPEKHIVIKWIADNFSAFWVSECEIAFARMPVTCWVATANQSLLGFACYDTTAKGLWGPTGVAESERGRGFGAALLLASMHDMVAQGYAYAVIGWTGPQEFYTKVCGATAIEGSRPGAFRGLLGIEGRS